MTNDDPTGKDPFHALADLLGVGTYEDVETASISTGTVTADTVYFDAANITEQLGTGTELHAKEFRLDTGNGELVFTADGDMLVVTHEREDDDGE